MPRRDRLIRSLVRMVLLLLMLTDGNQEFFLSVLSATTTKRDVKVYLSSFKYSAYPPRSTSPPLHVALFKVRALHTIDDKTVQGIAHTISQLARLGLSNVVVVDSVENEVVEPTSHKAETWRDMAIAQADRLVSALENEAAMKARRLDYVLGVSQIAREVLSTVLVRGNVEVQYSGILRETIAKGTIPVIPSIGYTTETLRATKVNADDVVLALTRNLAGLNLGASPLERPVHDLPDQNLEECRTTGVGVDRIILLDPLGGLPSGKRPDKAHIFVNLQQEYRDIRDELLGDNYEETSTNAIQPKLESSQKSSVFDVSNPVSQFMESKLFSETSRLQQIQALSKHNRTSSMNRHVKNLDLIQQTLALLPPSSSALITTPLEAATRAAAQGPHPAGSGVGTRRPKNPLIYNLLTDKPLVSSSLPVARMSSTKTILGAPTQSSPATFFKRGMPLTLVPDPRYNIWQPPRVGEAQLTMSDSRIDFPRLLNLIEDSFRRPLDVEHYLNRIRNRIAGIIIAGEYEGGAILTWELPTGVVDDGSEACRQRMVPYLDKFAVLKRSQGAGGVADIVFTAMVRTCFPQGVCWRSRKDNPVNKWYFERSAGTWKIPQTNWTMFWTTGDLMGDEQRFMDYEAVCRGVPPSWADNKTVVD